MTWKPKRRTFLQSCLIPLVPFPLKVQSVPIIEDGIHYLEGTLPNTEENRRQMSEMMSHVQRLNQSPFKGLPIGSVLLLSSGWQNILERPEEFKVRACVSVQRTNLHKYSGTTNLGSYCWCPHKKADLSFLEQAEWTM